MLQISKTKLHGFYRLTRVKTVMDFYPILIIAGFFATRTFINLASIVVALSLLANLISAFIINDIADAYDDAKDPKKVNRNPISAGIINKDEANTFYLLFFILGTVPLFFISIGAFLIGLVIGIIGYLYSSAPFRLKSRPLVDILSHGFFLAAGEVLVFALIPGSQFDIKTLLVTAGLYLFSMGGDLYNEIRDWEVDQLVGLKNTANLVGYNPARFLSYAFYLVGVILCIVGSVGVLFKL